MAAVIGCSCDVLSSPPMVLAFLRSLLFQTLDSSIEVNKVCRTLLPQARVKIIQAFICF